MTSMHEWSFSKSVDQMAMRAFDALSLDEGLANVIKACNAVLQVTFPIEIDGKIQNFTVGEPCTAHTGFHQRRVFATRRSSTRTKLKRWPH